MSAACRLALLGAGRCCRGCDDMTDQPKAGAYSRAAAQRARQPQDTVAVATMPPSPPPPLTLALLATRTAALPHLLHALPLRTGRRQRHDRAARLPAAAVLSHRPAAPGADAAFLRRDHAWLRRDVLVRRPGRAGRPLGDRRLYPRAAALAARIAPPTSRARGHERTSGCCAGAWSSASSASPVALIGWWLEPRCFRSPGSRR